MKQLQKVLAFVALSTAFAIQADEHKKGYQNQIADICEISNGKNIKFVVSCQSEDPICNYAPESYEESLQNSIHRFYMPMTTVASEVSAPFDLHEDEHGVEFVIEAQSVQKIISGSKILLIVAMS